MSLSLILLVLATVLVAAGWRFTQFLRGESLMRYDSLPGHWRPNSRTPSDQHAAVVAEVGQMLRASNTGKSTREKITNMRAMMDTMGDSADIDGVTILPADAGGVPGEWVIAAGADPQRRLLYIHGGAWMMGSSKSHRRITTRFSRETGAVVLAIDYRLIPEHNRLACVEDCLTAYRWLLDNGPSGQIPVQTLLVAGDSAGGNLTLITLAQARDAGLRAADAAVALSPATDGTLSSPSLLANLETDHMIGPMFGKLAKVPSWILLWSFWFKYSVRPSDPRISPVHHDLSKLPPTLIHVSEAEMLLDDARRYVNKATMAGSVAVLESWSHMVHVWHFFERNLPEADEAFAHIARFIELYAPRQK